MKGLQRAAFLDRDGVINIDTHYLHRWEDFHYVPGAVDAMRQLHSAGYSLVVVTNQSGIARGYYTEADFQQLTTQMCADLAAQGCPITAVYHCPHLPNATVPELRHDCDCRKPGPGMIVRACAQWQLDPATSVMVGDKASDIEAARAAGVGRAFLVTSGHALTPEERQLADAVFDDLAQCVTHLLAGSTSGQ